MRTPIRSAVEPPISTFRVRITGGRHAPAEARGAWREIEIAANQTLAELGDAIPLAFAIEATCGWNVGLPESASGEPAHYRHLPATGAGGTVASVRGLDAARVSVRELILPGASGRREFVLRLADGSWQFGVKLIDQAPMAESHLRYPRVVAGAGGVTAVLSPISPAAVPPQSESLAAVR